MYAVHFEVIAKIVVILYGFLGNPRDRVQIEEDVYRTAQ